MQITTTDKYIKIEYGKTTIIHPINSISYAINGDETGITLFRNNEAIGTSPLKSTTVNGTALTAENVDDLLNDLYN